MGSPLSSLRRLDASRFRRSLPLLIGLAFSAPTFLSAQQKPAVVDIVPAAQEPAKAPATPPAPAPAKPAAPIADAQKAAAPKPGDYSKEAVVFDKMYTRIHEEADGTGTHQTTARIRILADAGVKAMAVLEFTYTALNQQVDIAYVRVIKPDGSVVVTPAYNVQDLPADVTRTAPMYSDIHQKHVAVKGLGVGDTLEYQVTLTTVKPEVPGQFWFEYSFEKDAILLDEQVDLDVPADKAVTVATIHEIPQPAVTTAAGRKLYHWSSANLARPDPDAPPKSTKHIKPSIQVTTFSSWQQVGEWYQSLQHDSLAITPAIQAKADALTKGLTSDEDKTRAIFNDVALHIHYVGLEFGIGRYQPHPADDVLSNEYGDCKDKHTLLAAELKAEGIESWPVLISAGRELDPDTPSPAQFNHVITVIPGAGGKLLWMDSTEEVAPLGNLISVLRDKQALVIPNMAAGKPPYLERTPVDLPYLQNAHFDSTGKLSEQGVYTGHITQTYHGDVEFFLRTIFRQVPQSQWKEALQQFSRNIGFSGDISNPNISEIEKTSQPLEISYDYTREKFGEWDDHRIFPSIPASGWSLSPGVKEKKPADPIEIGSPGEQVYVSNITLPKGWSLVPESNVDLKEDWAEYHATYSLKDGVYKAERRLVMKKNKVPLEDWDKYLAFRRGIYADEVKTTWLMSGNSAADYNQLNDPALLRRGLVLGIPDELREKVLAEEDHMHQATAIFEADPPASATDKSAANGDCRTMMADADATSTSLSADDAHSLSWTQVQMAAWTCVGWAELEDKAAGTAAIFLEPVWKLTQSQLSGYLLGRAMEQKGDKKASAHLYELASITGVDLVFDGASAFNGELRRKIAEGYKRLTGNELTATPLDHGQYKGSLRAELDKSLEIHPLVSATKMNGTAYFLLVSEAGQPMKVRLISGDNSLASVVPLIRTKVPGPAVPTGSKARVFREFRVICTQWAGCDGSFFLPTKFQVPMGQGKFDVSAPTDPAGSHTVQIKLAPQ